MDWLITLIIGGIVGWVASIIMKTNAQMGVLLNIIVGVIGSIIGFWIAAQFGTAPTGGFARFLVALFGAIVLIFVLRALGMFGKRR